jgi:hypothetical protein
MKPSAKPDRLVLANAKLNLACRDALPVAKMLQTQTKNLDCQTIYLSTGTRQTSKKPNLCGLQPVARTLEMQAKNLTSAARFLSPGRWTLKQKT